MSENEHRGIPDLSQYDFMPTEALEQILRADAETPAEQESDMEQILYIMEVLARRKKEKQQSGRTAQQSWESFQQHYLPQQDIPEQNTKKMSGRPWLRRLIACAAVVILILGIPLSARALGLEEVWDIVARWAKETFSFVSGKNAEISEPNSISEEGFTSLQDALIKSNRDASLVPTWIPEGYQLDSVEKIISPDQEIYLAHYTNSEGYFVLRTQAYISSKPQNIEIGHEVTETYSMGSIDYYIFSNENQLQVIWASDEVEYSISGDISIDIAKQMINSIGKE